MPLKLEGGYLWEDVVCYVSCFECDLPCENVWKGSSMCWMFTAVWFFLYFHFETVVFRRTDMKFIALPK